MKTFPLNSIYLKSQMTKLGIKQWWLAEQLGVDKKTVMRWRDGSVKTIKAENLYLLLEILDCKLEDLVLSENEIQLATPDDQKIAAKLLMTSSIVDKLGPIGEWNVIESLLKATIIENLPLSILGEMYAQLTVSLWRQSKIEEADIFNKKTEEIAHELSDRSLLAKALLSKSNIFSWRGQTSESIATYYDCLSLEKSIDKKMLGAINSNLGAVYFEIGNMHKALEFQQNAISIFNVSGKAVNLSIAYCHLSLIYLEQALYELSRVAIANSIQQAELDDYKRGISMGNLVLSELEVHLGNKSNSLKLLETALASFKQQKIEEGLNYEFAGRILRLLEEFQKSKEMLRHGILFSKKFPMTEAGLQFELGKTLLKLNDNSYNKCFEIALTLYKKLNAEKRAQAVLAYVT